MRHLTCRFFIFIAVACLVPSLHADEPVQRDRTLTEWLEWYDAWAGRLIASDDTIKKFGTNALPELLKILATPDSPGNSNQFVVTYPHTSFNHLPTSEQKHRAVLAFEILGETAKPAVAKLTELLNKKETTEASANALVAIGEAEALTPLLNALTNQNEKVRETAAWKLIFMSRTNEIIPHLKNRLVDQAFKVRFAAACSLAMMESYPEAAIPILIESLEQQDNRILSMRLLGDFGPRAKSAIPELKAILGESDKDINTAEVVKGALDKIETR